MTTIKVDLCAGDKAEYGVGDQDLSVDVESLKDMRASENSAIDQEIGMALSLFIPMLEEGVIQVAHCGRVTAWLALRNAGIDVKWNDFDPRLNRATFTVERDEQRPPAGGPSAPSSAGDSEQSTSSKRSSRSSASKPTSTP